MSRNQWRRPHSSPRPVRVAILGDSDVGKTSLLNYLVSADSQGASYKPQSFPPTIGANVDVVLHDWNDDSNGKFIIECIDVGGDRTYNALSRAPFYDKVNAVLLVYDLSNHASLVNVLAWHGEIADHLSAKREAADGRSPSERRRDVRHPSNAFVHRRSVQSYEASNLAMDRSLHGEGFDEDSRGTIGGGSTSSSHSAASHHDEDSTADGSVPIFLVGMKADAAESLESGAFANTSRSVLAALRAIARFTRFSASILQKVLFLPDSSPIFSRVSQTEVRRLMATSSAEVHRHVLATLKCRSTRVSTTKPSLTPKSLDQIRDFFTEVASSVYSLSSV